MQQVGPGPNSSYAWLHQKPPVWKQIQHPTEIVLCPLHHIFRCRRGAVLFLSLCFLEYLTGSPPPRRGRPVAKSTHLVNCYTAKPSPA